MEQQTKMILSDDMIKQVFFYCGNSSKDAVLADGVDIIEFARKIEAVLTPTIQLREHQRCVKIVKDLNPEVGKKLHSLRP
jgi:hypothetical protein